MELGDTGMMLFNIFMMFERISPTKK